MNPRPMACSRTAGTPAAASMHCATAMGTLNRVSAAVTPIAEMIRAVEMAMC